MMADNMTETARGDNTVALLWIGGKDNFLGGVYATEELANGAVDNDENLIYEVEVCPVVTG